MARKTARGVVFHAGTLLLIERWRHNAESNELLHYFSIPGGAIENSETPEQAVVRELFEEMHMLIRPRAQVAKNKTPQGTTHYYFLCDYLSGSAELSPDSPEANRAKNQYKPRWVGQAEFAKINLHPDYEPVRGIIKELFVGH